MDLELNRLTATVNGKPIYTFRKFRRSMDIEVFPAVTFGPSGCEVNFGAAPFKRALPPGYVTVDPCYLFSQSFTQLWGLVLFCQWAAHLEENESKNYVFDDATMSAFKMVTNKVLEFTRYRDGPLPVVLGQPLTDAARKDYETRCGRVSVVEGKWYYEVTVLNDDPDISVGWLTGDGNIGGANKEESTGAKGFSWVLETKRMIACGGAHQVSLGRHKWTAGDVIGCLLDCDEKKVSFTINGVLQKRLHDDEESALFQNIVIDPFGASPLVTRHVKSAVLHNFESSELLHCPEEFCPLGGTDVIHRAVVEYVLFGSQLMKDRNQLALERGSAVKILEYVAQNTDFNPSNQEIYSLSKVLQIHQARGREEESAVRGLAVGECVAHVAALSTLSCAAQSVLPFVHVEYTTKEVDPNMSARVYRAIQPAFFTVKAFCLPYVALELVRRHFMATTEESDLVKLTVNRRRALSTLSDPRATRAERIESSLFGQIYKLISDKPASMFRSGRKLWGITFLGEGADDVGGPYRESIAQICTELMSDKLPLFLPSANQQNNTGTNRDLFVVNPSLNSQQDLDLYRFLGRLIAGCLRRSELLSLSLSPVVWKDLVGERSTLDDLERVDSALVSSLRYLDESRRKGEVSAVLELFTSFTTTVEPAGEVELFPGGKNVPVSKNNLHVLLELTLDYHTRQVGAAQREALCRGFWEVIPLPVVSLLKWYELEEWVCGQKDYDPVVLLNHATYGGISSQSPRVLYLKDTLLQFTREERAKFMRFVSGRERLTPGMQLHIMPDADDDDDTLNKNTKLPHASTCFYQLVLPNYSSQAQMREKLLLAIEHCLDIDATASFQQDNALTRVVIDDDEFEDYSHLQQ
ncbi:hypothetical protein AGDE_14307 [Angomonas deanei]|uniref:SPRY domain/HECT-domain (Ubiquitin-transferase), putative n=1 Tax=Angomonas deanei TaxID=59799 RepID=A0A7G2CIQ0_9TRYP|nr:hypothetical protein AGDE_14307 [Angomonas deanei]CAD2219656.1 SPRY domain/HECT-domain (ubiquitin-transferase), putative [Angomonas deanei]|eukprot:EPY21070.1 hypothetical protein AGDE_14307 [Angomonas deanei]